MKGPTVTEHQRCQGRKEGARTVRPNIPVQYRTGPGIKRVYQNLKTQPNHSTIYARGRLSSLRIRENSR